MPFKILIVEDEILIADNIKRFLVQQGYDVVGIAISYDEATFLIETEHPDIILLDIRLNGEKSGIDIATYLNHKSIKIPFVFLTSQMDSKNIEDAKKTFPSGYLSKPIQHESLKATIEITLHKINTKAEQQNIIQLNDGNSKHLIPANDISFIQAEHVYAKIFKTNGEYILQRSSLKDLITILPNSLFIQTHRSFIVNKNHISRYDSQYIYINTSEIPISRSKKKEVINKIEQ